MKKQIIIGSTIFILLLTISLLVTSQPNENGLEINKMSAASYEKTLKMSSRSPKDLINSKMNALNGSENPEKVKEKINRYEDLIDKDTLTVANNIEELEKMSESIVSFKLKNNIKTLPLETWSPRVILALSLLNNESYKETLERRQDDFKLSSEHWVLLRRLAYSGDLVTLIRQNRLDSNYLSLENLKRFYQ
jgi:hypothetical protein